MGCIRTNNISITAHFTPESIKSCVNDLNEHFGLFVNGTALTSIRPSERGGIVLLWGVIPG